MITAEARPRASLVWVSGWDSCRPRKPPIATWMSGPATVCAVLSTSWPTAMSVAYRSFTVTLTTAVCPSALTRSGRSAGEATAVTCGMARSAVATSSVIRSPDPEEKSSAWSWSTMGTASADDPGNARLSRSWAADESVPLRMNESADSPPKARFAPMIRKAIRNHTPITRQPFSAQRRPRRYRNSVIAGRPSLRVVPPAQTSQREDDSPGRRSKARAAAHTSAPASAPKTPSAATPMDVSTHVGSTVGSPPPNRASSPAITTPAAAPAAPAASNAAAVPLARARRSSAGTAARTARPHTAASAKTTTNPGGGGLSAPSSPIRVSPAAVASPRDVPCSMGASIEGGRVSGQSGPRDILGQGRDWGWTWNSLAST